MSKEKCRDIGPIQILCEEIGVEFSKEMEGQSTLVAFVNILVCEIETMLYIANRISHLTEEHIITETERFLSDIKEILKIDNKNELIKAADELSNLYRLPGEGPVNHYNDMLSSCLHAIMFGLEVPCRSRHAADAANHVWRRKYGITLFDKNSNAWGKLWAIDRFHEAIST